MISEPVKVLFIEETPSGDQLVSRFAGDELWGQVEVLLVRSVTIAMGYLDAETPDVVVTDLDDEAVRHVRAAAAERGVPLVELSPDESDGSYQAPGRLGRAVRYALKCRRQDTFAREPTGVHQAYETMRTSLAETKRAFSGVTNVSDNLRRAVRMEGDRSVRSRLTPAAFPAMARAKSDADAE